MRNTYEGHRERIRTRVMENGFRSLAPHEFLEYILFAPIKRADTKQIAYALLDKFGSIEEVMKASIEELCQVKGVGETSALVIKSYDFYNQEIVGKTKKKKVIIKSKKDLRTYLKEVYKNKANEELHLLFIDDKDVLVQDKIYSMNERFSITVDKVQIMKDIISKAHCKLIISHNHTSGTASPSNADKEFTKDLVGRVRASINKPIIDHIIICSETDDVYSFADNELMNIYKL